VSVRTVGAEGVALTNGLTTEARITGILEAFERQVDGVRGSAVADRDGLPIANGFKEPFDLLSVASMGALGMQSARKVSQFIGVKAPRMIVIECEDAKVLIRDIGGGQANFIVVVGPDANLGFTKLQIDAATKRLEDELGFGPPVMGSRVDEVFLLTKGGILIAHLSRRMIHPADRDILAAMFTVVQEFVRDSFRDKGGSLEVLQLANLSVRLVRGTHTTLAIVSSGALGDQFIAHAAGTLKAFENWNEGLLDPWDGGTDSLRNLDQLIEEMLNPPGDVGLRSPALHP
jgi:predicted regulator of Ras-like GTPase activity (Roadblock/LC7/MglB family)